MGQEQSPDQISVIIVDDHSFIRDGLIANLELHNDINIVGTCSNGEEALEKIRELQPDVVIMDINLPLMNGVQVTQRITSDRYKTRIVMLTGYDDVEQIIHAMRAGAAAYCSKDIEPDKLVDAIRLVLKGHRVVNDRVYDAEGLEAWMDKGIEDIAGEYYVELAESFSPLSPREMEILQHVTRGLSNKEIASTLQISHQTVKNHMTSILRKLAVEDRTQAAVFALRRGWVRLQDTKLER